MENSVSQKPTPSADQRIAALEAENARLRQDAARCQGLFAAMGEAFVLFDVVYDDAGHAVDARVVDANDAFAALVGRSTAETVGLTLRELLPAIAPWWIDTAGQVALTGAPVRFGAHGDVTARDYEVEAWCPGPGQCAALLHDVTEQKRVEEALRASERRLARNLDAMTRLQALSTRLVPTDELMPLLHEILAAAADLTGTDKGNIQFLDASTGKLRIVAQQGLSRQYCAYFAEDGCDATCKAALAARRRVVVADLREEPRLQGTEDMAVCQAEGLRAVISTPLMARDGRPLGMISNHYTAPHQPDEHELHVLDLLARMAADVVERSRAEEALRESEARFRELADAMPQLVWTARPDGTVDYYNRRYVEFGGIAPTADRWEWAPVLHPDDVERTAQVWHRALETGAVYEAEHRARRADGGYRWHLSRALPVRDAQGRIIRWYGTATDIHDTKMAQEALRESERRLRDLNETLEDRVAERTAQLRTLAAELAFAEERERQRLADLLHDDLQQTLAAAVYHLDLVREQVSSEECRTSLEGPMTMLREAIHTSRTLSAELSPTLLRDTRLGAMLQNLAQLVEEQHGLRVAVDDREPADAPPPPDDVRLLLYRCIRELLYNAKKHAGVAGASLLVHRPTPHFIEVTVADEGHGFDPEVVHRRGPRPGGLGLFSIEERLAYIGGEVRIDSAPGRGTRIMLHVPLSHAALDAGTPGTSGVVQPAATTAAEDSLETGDGERRLRVLLADDHAVVRSALGSLLEGQPDMVVVGEAGDGVEAVELARALRPDVVLMDVGMPQMDGIEATRRLKAELPGIRVIGLSMYGGEKEGLMRQAGAEAYVPKGGPPAALLAAIRDTGKEA